MRGTVEAAHASEWPDVRVLSTMNAEAARGPQRVAPQALAGLAPLAGLSAERLAELAAMVELERVPRTTDVLAQRAGERRSLFLISGEMLLAFAKGGTWSWSAVARRRGGINRRTPAVARSRAITDVDVIVIDDEVLDILATWDEMAASSSVAETARPGIAQIDWRPLSGMFSISSLRSGAFARCPLRISIRCWALRAFRCVAAKWDPGRRRWRLLLPDREREVPGRARGRRRDHGACRAQER